LRQSRKNPPPSLFAAKRQLYYSIEKEKPALGGLSFTLFFALKNAYTHYRRITNAAGRGFIT